MEINKEQGFLKIIVILLLLVGVYFGYQFFSQGGSVASLTQKATTFLDEATLDVGSKIQELAKETPPFDFSSFGTGTSFSSEAGIGISGIVSETNKHREQAGLRTLSVREELNRSALVKAKDIIARQYFEHDAPDGTTVSDLISNQGYAYIRVGENLALGDFLTSTEVVDAWMASPGHKANILDKSFTEIGIGIVQGVYNDKNVSVIVQHFGTPRSVCPSIDSALRTTITNKELEFEVLSNELEALLREVEEGRSAGNTMNTEAELYNQKLIIYQGKLTELNALRQIYNAQVNIFNTCLESAQTQ